MQTNAWWVFLGWQACKNVHLVRSSLMFLQRRASTLLPSVHSDILQKGRTKNCLGGPNAWFVERNSRMLLVSWTLLARHFEFVCEVLERVTKIGLFVVPSVILAALSILVASDRGMNRWKIDNLQSLMFRILSFALKQCGGAFIKAGQWASTRPDIFPSNLCKELYQLHSDTRPHSQQWTLHLLRPLMPDIISAIQMKPIGCGTVAQVHNCTLWDGTMVAVKIIHPNIRKTIEVDLQILRIAARLAQVVYPPLKWINLPGELDVFSKIMFSQCDMRIEYENLRQFCKNFNRPRSKITFPTPLYSNQNVLVETLENGIPLQHFINDSSISGHLKDYNARKIFKAFMKMILKDNFIHADLHPGNILVKNGGEEMVFLDAGLATKLNTRDHKNFIDLFKAIIIQRDGFEAGKLLIERSHPLSQETVVGGVEFCKEIQILVERTFKSSKGFSDIILSKISFGDIFGELLTSIKRHHVKLNENYANIITSILCIEGVGRQLSHGINLLPLLTDVAKLYLETKRQE